MFLMLNSPRICRRLRRVPYLVLLGLPAVLRVLKFDTYFRQNFRYLKVNDRSYRKIVKWWSSLAEKKTCFWRIKIRQYPSHPEHEGNEKNISYLQKLFKIQFTALDFFKVHLFLVLSVLTFSTFLNSLNLLNFCFDTTLSWQVETHLSTRIWL